MGESAIGRVSNEIEFGFEGELTRDAQLDERIYCVEEVGRNIVELNLSKANGVEELNEWLVEGITWLKKMGKAKGAWIYGGGALANAPEGEPKEYLTTTLFPGLGRQLMAIMGFQVVLGIKKGKEKEGMAIYERLSGLLDAFALLSASSESIFIANGECFRQQYHPIGMARLLLGYERMYRAVSDILPVGLAKALFSQPKAHGLEDYEAIRARISERLKLEVKKAKSRVWWSAGFEDKGFMEQMLRNGLAPHQLYHLIRIRTDHADDAHAFSIELRVMDNPAKDLEESLEMMQALNELVIWSALNAERAKPKAPIFLESAREQKERLEKARELAKTLLRRAKISARAKKMLKEKVKKMDERVRKWCIN